jgi:hypothetical protein
VLLLDELTTFLDVEDQFGVLRAVKDVTRAGARGRGVTAVWVTHRWGPQVGAAGSIFQRVAAAAEAGWRGGGPAVTFPPFPSCRCRVGTRLHAT